MVYSEWKRRQFQTQPIRMPKKEWKKQKQNWNERIAKTDKKSHKTWKNERTKNTETIVFFSIFMFYLNIGESIDLSVAISLCS